MQVTKTWIERNHDKKRPRIELKRFFLPNFKVHSTCPNCKTDHVLDLATTPIPYPVPGKESRLRFNCTVNYGYEELPKWCKTEWSVGVIVYVSISTKNPKDRRWGKKRERLYSNKNGITTRPNR